MPNELKACPYCNGEYVNSPDGHYVHPFNDCDDRGRILQAGDIVWFNHRPIEDALQARIEELEKAAVVWHKYPDEKPIEFGRYAIHRRHNVVPRIDVRYWTGNDWRDRDDSIYDRDIAYWAYLPAPPKEGE